MRTLIFLLILLVVGACSFPTPATSDIPAQYVKDTTAIRSYLTQNGIAATKLSPGIWIAIDSVAAGIRPVFSDSMVISYKMKLLPNEVIVDQSATSANLILSQLIFGLRIGMPYFQKGSKGRVFIPSYYGYQDVAYGNVPANSSLIFDFKLIDVKDSNLKADTVKINQYLKDHAISAQTDASGLRYSIDSLHNGSTPSIINSVAVTYVVKDMVSGKVIDQATTPTSFRLADALLFWQVALPLLPEGSKATLYVPSSLTMLPGTTNTDPQYNNLICEVHLVEVH